MARLVAAELRRRDVTVALLDDAEVDAHLVRGRDGHAFDALGWIVGLLADAGMTAIVAATMPRRDDREALRAVTAQFVEVHVDTPAEVCAERVGADDSGYEDPLAPELRVQTHDRDAAATAAQVLSYLETSGLVPT